MLKRCKTFWAASFAELKNVRSLTLASLLTAIYAVSYSPFAGNIVIIPGLMEFRLGFVAVAVAGLLCGPVAAMLVGLLGDFIGTILFYGGSFFFGYTLTWMVMGLVFGCFLYKHKISLGRVIAAMVVDALLVKMLLTTWCQSLMGFGPFMPLFVSRIVRNAIMLPINTVLLLVVIRAVMGIYRRVGRGHAA